MKSRWPRVSESLPCPDPLLGRYLPNNLIFPCRSTKTITYPPRSTILSLTFSSYESTNAVDAAPQPFLIDFPDNRCNRSKPSRVHCMITTSFGAASERRATETEAADAETQDYSTRTPPNESAERVVERASECECERAARNLCERTSERTNVRSNELPTDANN